MLAHALLLLLLFSHCFHSDTFWSFWFFCFVFVLWVTKTVYLNWCYYKFSLSEDIFSLWTHLFIDKKHAQWNLDTTFCFVFVLWVTKIVYLNWCYYKFSLSEDIFSLRTHHFIHKKHTQWNLDTTFCFVFVLWVTKIVYLNWCYYKFSLSEDIFSLRTHLFIDKKHTQWNLDTKLKAFHESTSCLMKYPSNSISWNALRETFHSLSFPLEICPTSL